jgi:energy-coupling factor transport system substrate-specific component
VHSSIARNRFGWRVIDIVTAAVIGVAAGFLFFVWNLIYSPVSAPLESALPGLQALVYGVWLIAAILGAAIIRKPGAAIFTELVAAMVSATLGASWGILTLQSGLIQGLGAELVFLLFFYRNWRPFVLVLAGAAAGLAMAVNDIILWYPGSKIEFMLIYGIASIVSGAVVAGLGGWALTNALARTGVLSRFEVGRERIAQV